MSNTKMASDGERAASPGVARTLTVLETLVTSEEDLTLSALARHTDIPLATCASIVYTLELRGYASRRVVGRSHFWHPTLRLYGLATQLVRKVDLSSIALTEMRELAERFDMPVHIGVLTGPSVVYVAKAARPSFIQFDTYPGKLSPFNLTALGKAIAAFLPEEDLAPLLSQLTPGRGPNAPDPTKAKFLTELQGVRQRGYAVENQEEQEDIGCVAAPFFDAEGGVAGAVGITGFARDLTGKLRERAATGTVEVAEVVSAKLGFTPPSPNDTVG